MTQDQLKQLITDHIQNYRVGDEIRLPSSIFWQTVEVTWLACEAESRSRGPVRDMEMAGR